MPRTYRRRLGARSYQNYSQERLEEALNAIKTKKMTLREAAKRYNIHRNTLWLKLRGRTTKPVGGQTIFSKEEEELFVAHTVAMSTFGFPITSFDLRCVANSFLDRTGRKIHCCRNNLPGRDWADSFLKRNKNVLSQRTAKNISYARASTDEEIINNFFNNLEQELEGVLPSHIWNYDETNLVDDPGNNKVLTKRGTKYPEQIRNATKACTSLMVCGNAEGLLAPLYVNYKADKLWSTWTEGGPDGARYNRTKSGWFDHQAFEDWFTSLLLPILKKQNGVKVIIGDNLSSHINLEVLHLCEENNIKFIALPPNATHLLQPLDVAYFRSMKSHWRQVLSEWKETAKGSRCSTIPKDEFPSLLKKLMTAIKNSESNLKAGFKKSGIYPIDRSQVLKRLPSSILNESDALKDVIGNSFLEKLAEKRLETTQKRTIRRHKRLNVPPGKSIGVVDINFVNEPVASVSRANTDGKTKKKITKKPTAQKDTSDEVSDSDDLSLYDTDDSMGDDWYEHDSDIASDNSNNDPPAISQTETEKSISDLEPGKYVLVNYEGKLYPGLFKEKTASGYLVRAMAETLKGNWKWPIKVDEIQYTKEEIVRIIKEPEKLGRRDVYKVPELINTNY